MEKMKIPEIQIQKEQAEELHLEEIYQIYDRIFKRIFSLSNLAIINMINGLFQTNHPTDSKVEYFNKE